MENKKNLNSIPYAKWLETALQEMIALPIKGICLSAVTGTGEAYTNYYEISMADKLLIAGLIQQDAMLDTMAANGMIEYSDDEGDADGQEEE